MFTICSLKAMCKDNCALMPTQRNDTPSEKTPKLVTIRYKISWLTSVWVTRGVIMVWWGDQENTKSGNMRKTTRLIGLLVLQFTLTVELISSEDRNCSPNVCVCRKGNSCSLEWKDCKCKRENALSLMYLQQRNVFVRFHGWKYQDKT